jgi:hypothetical protein
MPRPDVREGAPDRLDMILVEVYGVDEDRVEHAGFGERLDLLLDRVAYEHGVDVEDE